MNKWVVIVAGVLAAMVGVLLLVLQGKLRAANQASADMFAAWHKQQIAEQQAKLAQLQQQAVTDSAALAAAQTVAEELAVKRAKLEAAYVSKGLSSEEVAKRLTAYGF